jgi:hypothetical protein
MASVERDENDGDVKWRSEPSKSTTRFQLSIHEGMMKIKRMKNS